MELRFLRRTKNNSSEKRYEHLLDVTETQRVNHTNVNVQYALGSETINLTTVVAIMIFQI